MKKMKVVLSIVLALSMLITIGALPSLAEGENGKITVGTVTAKTGATVEVPVTIDTNPGVVGMRLKLTYDANVVKLIGVEDKGVISGFIGLDSYGSGKYLSWMDNCVVENDKVTQTVADKDNTATGVIATLKFEVLGATGTSSDITLTASGSYDIVNYALNEVKFDITAGKITVADFILGDLNGDGEIDFSDVNILYRYAFEELSIDSIDMDEATFIAAADINGDGEIDFSDVNMLYRAAFGEIEL